MGAINYGSSDIISIGLNCNNLGDYKDVLIADYGQEDGLFEYERELENACDYAEMTIKEYRLDNITIDLKGGYYDGFYVQIETHYGSYVLDTVERKEILKELTQLKKCLIELVENCGTVAYVAGWCTAYYTQKETLTMINKAIKAEKERVCKLPTARTVQKADR